MDAQSAALLPDEGLSALRVFQGVIRAALRSSWIREHALLADRTGDTQLGDLSTTEQTLPLS
jgi:hypothetical protein